MSTQTLPSVQTPSGTEAVSPARRAAVIIAMLGEEAAKPIVEKLDDAALTRVVQELETISVLPRDVLADIVMDFLGHLRGLSGALRGGRERTRELVRGILDTKRMELFYAEPEEDESELFDFSVPMSEVSVWELIQEKEPRVVADYLARLTPNIISMILGKLEVSFTSDLLCFLDEQKLPAVMGYMVEAEEMDPGIESVIARMVQMEFLNAEQVVEADDASHLESIGELLSLIPSSRRENVVEFLKTEHESKLASIERGILTVENLPDIMARNSVPVLFREMEDTVITKVLGVLQATYPNVADFLLGNISSRMADQFRDNLQSFSPPPAEEGETLLRDFLAETMSLKQRGLVTLQKAPAAAA